VASAFAVAAPNDVLRLDARRLVRVDSPAALAHHADEAAGGAAQHPGHAIGGDVAVVAAARAGDGEEGTGLGGSGYGPATN